METVSRTSDLAKTVGSTDKALVRVVLLLALTLLLTACAARRPLPAEENVFALVDYPVMNFWEDDFEAIPVIVDHEYLQFHGLDPEQFGWKPPYFYFVNIYNNKERCRVVNSRAADKPSGPVQYFNAIFKRGYVETDPELRQALASKKRPWVPGKVKFGDPLFAKALFYHASREKIYYFANYKFHYINSLTKKDYKPEMKNRNYSFR